MVGGGGVQVARLQAMPQRLLVAARAEGRAHHVAGGGLPVRVAVHAVVQQQVPGQHLAVDRLALGPGIGDFVQGLAGGHVHQVQRRAQGLGDADRPAGGFALDLGWPRQWMGFRPGDALGQQLALQVVHQLAVLGVHRGHRAQFQAALEAGHQGVVGGHDGVLVGHEMLEAVDPVMPHQLGHFLAHLLAPPGHGHVEAIVAGRFLGPTAPLVEGFQQRLPGVGNHEVDDRGGAASQARRRPAEEVLAGHGAHEGQLHVGVGIDAAGHQVLAAAVEHFAACGNVQMSADGSNQALCAQDIGFITFVMGNNGGATNQQRHSEFLAGMTGCLPVLTFLLNALITK